MKKLTVTHGDLGVTVTEATTLVGMRRTRLRFDVQERINTEPMDIDRRLIATYLYPDLVAAAVDFKGMTEPTFDEFLEIPEGLEIAWENAVYELNPHWRLVAPESAEKKELNSPDDLSSSAVPQTTTPAKPSRKRP